MIDVQVKEIIEIGDNNISNPLNIAVGIDENYVAQMGVMLTSIVDNNSSMAFNVHIFTSSALTANVDKFNVFTKCNKRVNIKIYVIEESNFNDLHIAQYNMSIATYFRIVIPQILYNHLDYVLYMDADIICINKINDLINETFDGYPVLAAIDQIPDDISAKYKKALGMEKDAEYFNAGILYIDLKKWHDLEISSKAFAVLQQRKLKLMDQDALNIVAVNMWKKLPIKYNYMYKDDRAIPNDTVLIHYTGGMGKPWQPWNDRLEGAILFNKYRAMSLWKDYQYKLRHYREWRMWHKEMLRRGEYCRAAKYYMCYIMAKLKTLC